MIWHHIVAGIALIALIAFTSTTRTPPGPAILVGQATTVR